MSHLAHRQSKIQEKRKQTPWREFVMEICSWKPLMFYKNQGMISIYPETVRSPKLINFKSYDDGIAGVYEVFNGSFFGDFVQLLGKTGLPNVAQINTENSDFSDTIINGKSVYLSNTVINGCENVVYSISIKDYSKDVFESLMVRDMSQNIYNSKAIIKSFNIFYSKDISNSNNVWFSSNLQSCSECIHCNDLQNQSYFIHNIKYEKDQYLHLKKEILAQKHKFHQNTTKGLNLACKNVDGTSSIECSDCSNTHYSYNTKNGNNLFLHGSAKGSEFAYDCFTGGSPYASHMYGVMGAGACEHVYSSVFVSGGSSNIYYSINLDACSFCLGCIGLKNKSYCILNKQYSKEERYQKVVEIFTKMEAEGTLGQFFPATMNPFYFNDTAACLIDPSFTKEEVTAKGYLRRDEPVKVDIPADAKIVAISGLTNFEGRMVGTEFFPSTTDRKNSIPTDALRHINPDILKYVIQDEQGNYYRIIPMEYKFLMKHGLPLPRKHRLERMKENFRIN